MGHPWSAWPPVHHPNGCLHQKCCRLTSSGRDAGQNDGARRLWGVEKGRSRMEEKQGAIGQKQSQSDVRYDQV